MPGKKVAEEIRREQILDAAYRVALRERLAGLTSRAVAAEARVSQGLVFFHFRNRKALLLALLEWLLAETILRRAVNSGPVSGGAAERLASEVRSAVEALAAERERIELFFDYWFMSSKDEAIRKRIRGALKLYRDSYLPLTRAVVEERPAEYAGVTAEALADMVTSYIEGCALRLVADPSRRDLSSSASALSVLLR